MTDAPAQTRPPAELAAEAAKQGAWAEAVTHWCVALKARPGDRAATIGLGEALARLGAEGAAAVLVHDVLADHPDDLRLMGLVAHWAERGRNVTLALGLRRQLAAASPNEPAVAALLGRALRDGGETAESATVLAAADARFPDRPGVLRERAFTAMVREEWALARDCWAAVVRLDPANPQAASRLKICTDRAAAMPTPAPSVAAAPRLQASPEVMAMLAAVVSLGAGPDLGVVLRDHGCVPAGPIAFARATTGSVIAALESRFDGFGDAPQLRLEVDGPEYVAVDTRYDIRVPTGVATGQVATPDILAHVGDAMRAGRDALLADLESGSKLFVHAAPSLSDDDIDRLIGAMRDIGPITALFVRVAMAEPGEAGDVEEIQEGLFVAAIDRLDPEAGAEPSGMWLDLCARAYRGLAERADLGGFAARRRAA